MKPHIVSFSDQRLTVPKTEHPTIAKRLKDQSAEDVAADYKVTPR